MKKCQENVIASNVIAFDVMICIFEVDEKVKWCWYDGEYSRMNTSKCKFNAKGEAYFNTAIGRIYLNQCMRTRRVS